MALTSELEKIVMSCILGSNNCASGYEIRQFIENDLQRKITFGAIYSVLDRLEEKGFTVYELKEGLEERGSRPQRFFSVSGAGQLALRDAIRMDMMVIAYSGLVGG